MEPTLSPKLAAYVVAEDARGLIRFIEQAIGGRLSYEVSDAEGLLRHAEVQIADGILMIGEKPAGRDPFPAMLHLYVDDAHVAFRRAVDAGAKSVREPADAGDGTHRGGVCDPWGNEWWFSSPGKPS
jgi:PhnB protein